jgi:predicted ATPase
MIERIIIENFKSIRKLDLELKPINILVGANGAGKSNFISFLKLTNQIYEQRLQEYIGNNIDSILYFGRDNSEHLYGLIDFNNTNAVHFWIYPESQSNKGYIKSLGDYFNSPKFKDKNYSKWHKLIWESDVKESSIKVFQEPRAKFIRYYLESFKIYHFHDTGKDSPMKRMNDLNDNHNLRENGKNLAAFLYFLQEKHLKEFQSIENKVHSVAPFFDRFDLKPNKLNENQIELRWLEKGSDSYFNAYDLSDGTLRFIALTTLLLQPDLPKTIIIDEPELGLHPFAINKLAAMMKQAAAKGSQVIVSTQSVGLVDNFEPEDIITVDREDNQSVFRRLDSEDLKDWLEDYTLGELWNKNVIGARP